MKKVSIHIRALTMCLAATILSSCAYSDQSSSISASFPDSQATSETSSSASNKNLGSIEDDVPSNEITLGKALQISGKSTRANSKALADNEIQVADQSEQLYPLVYGNNTILFEEMVYDANGSSFTLYKYNVNEGALSQIGNYAYDYRYENGTILDDRYYFRAPCVVDDGGNLIVQWQKIDCNTGEMEIVYSETVQSLYTFQKSCDNDQIYLMVDAVRGDTYGRHYPHPRAGIWQSASGFVCQRGRVLSSGIAEPFRYGGRDRVAGVLAIVPCGKFSDNSRLRRGGRSTI